MKPPILKPADDMPWVDSVPQCYDTPQGRVYVYFIIPGRMVLLWSVACGQESWAPEDWDDWKKVEVVKAFIGDHFTTDKQWYRAKYSFMGHLELATSEKKDTGIAPRPPVPPKPWIPMVCSNGPGCRWRGPFGKVTVLGGDWFCPRCSSAVVLMQSRA